jgi:hypothetical protein
VHLSGKYGHNQQVVDYMMQFNDPGGETKVRPVYGPRNSKIFARYYNPNVLGNLIATSDDNLGLYALSKYVQSQIGAYPHLPMVNTQPSSRPWQPADDVFTFSAAGGVIANASAPDDSLSVDYFPEDNNTVLIDQFIPDSDLPADYLAALKDWAQVGVGLTNLVSLNPLFIPHTPPLMMFSRNHSTLITQRVGFAHLPELQARGTFRSRTAILWQSSTAGSHTGPATAQTYQRPLYGKRPTATFSYRAMGTYTTLQVRFPFFKEKIPSFWLMLCVGNQIGTIQFICGAVKGF